MTVLQKLRNYKIPLTPEQRNIVSDEEMRESFNFLLDKIAKEKGESWFETANGEEIEKTIMVNLRRAGKEYFENKEREKLINIITEKITGMEKG